MKESEQYAEKLLTAIKKVENLANQEQMRNYMKGKFDYLGIKSPDRRDVQKQFFKQEGIPEIGDCIAIAKLLWDSQYREAQYAAMDIIDKRKRYLSEDHLKDIELFITTKSWWDTVDFLAINFIGTILKKSPHLVPIVPNKWSDDSDFWLNRTAILFQLKYRLETDTTLLAGYLDKHKSSKKFFLRKAIGWALREYSIYNPQWVMDYVESANLQGLSKREALKIIQKSS